MPAESLLTIAEASRRTGLAHWTLRRLVKSRRIPHVIIAGVRRVRLSDIKATIREVAVES